MNEMPAKRRIAIVEDDPNLRDYLIEIISDVVDLDLAGAAGSIAAARKLVRLQPDLFLLDIGLPDGSGLDLIADLRRQLDCKILVITSFGDRETVVAALGSGADGYLLKDAKPAELIDGIEATLAGGAPVSAAAAVYLLERLRGDAVDRTNSMRVDNGLTPRETELLNLFARGFSYRESAELMGVAPQTIGNFVKSIYGKLEVHSRSEAIYEAVKTGQIRL